MVFAATVCPSLWQRLRGGSRVAHQVDRCHPAGFAPTDAHSVAGAQHRIGRSKLPHRGPDGAATNLQPKVTVLDTRYLGK